MPYAIEFKPSAAVALRHLPRQVQSRIVTKAEALADNPRPSGCKKLAGADALYRVRIGDYRMVYEVRDAVLTILIVRIGHRRDVYRDC